MNAIEVIRRIDADLDLAGEVCLKPHQWAGIRYPLVREVVAAAKLAEALVRAQRVLEHFTYSAENRAALADIREALKDYGA